MPIQAGLKKALQDLGLWPEDKEGGKVTMKLGHSKLNEYKEHHQSEDALSFSKYLNLQRQIVELEERLIKLESCLSLSYRRIETLQDRGVLALAEDLKQPERVNLAGYKLPEIKIKAEGSKGEK